MRVTRIRSLSATLLLMALLVSSASASTYTTVLHAYETTGTISPCQFSSGQLSAAVSALKEKGVLSGKRITRLAVPASSTTFLTMNWSARCASGFFWRAAAGNRHRS